jgi:hypothetical protein
LLEFYAVTGRRVTRWQARHSPADEIGLLICLFADGPGGSRTGILRDIAFPQAEAVSVQAQWLRNSLPIHSAELSMSSSGRVTGYPEIWRAPDQYFQLADDKTETRLTVHWRNSKICSLLLSMGPRLSVEVNHMRRPVFTPVFCLLGFLLLATPRVQAAVTITGTVGSSGAYLVSGSPVNYGTHAVLKITFEDQTSGTNLALCAGTAADFTAQKCTIRLSDSGGPGFNFLTIVDAATLNGMAVYVLRDVGSANAKFTLSVE